MRGDSLSCLCEEQNWVTVPYNRDDYWSPRKHQFFENNCVSVALLDFPGSLRQEDEESHLDH